MAKKALAQLATHKILTACHHNNIKYATLTKKTTGVYTRAIK